MSIQQSQVNSNTSSKRSYYYQLQDAASDILGVEHAVSSCMRQTVAGGKVQVVHDGKAARYANVVTCQRGWLCPICAKRLANERKHEIEYILHGAHQRGEDALFLTLTLAHHAGSELDKLLDTLLAAWRGVFSGDKTGERQVLASVAAQIKALEIRISERTGWHPHLHVLLTISHRGMDATEAALLDERIAEVVFSRYQKAVERRGMVAERAAFNCQRVEDYAGGVAQYVSKFEPTLELTNGQSKDGQQSYSIFQLLAMYSKDKNAKVCGRSVASLFKEYATATAKRRQISYSRGLFDEEQYKKDMLAKEPTPEVWTVLAVVDSKLWWRICKQHLRAAVLEVADVGDAAYLSGFLEQIRLGVVTGGTG